MAKILLIILITEFATSTISAGNAQSGFWLITHWNRSLFLPKNRCYPFFYHSCHTPVWLHQFVLWKRFHLNRFHCLLDIFAQHLALYLRHEFALRAVAMFFLWTFVPDEKHNLCRIFYVPRLLYNKQSQLNNIFHLHIMSHIWRHFSGYILYRFNR